ncbi:MAG: uncharacterized protein KVP18_003106 [Porospora cf. gigantea A]|uniref:uncharacterized protein n=1 Tax=Porospora cf. gigantea A TaxID=2853593 RepID=UPI00355A9422|nr:MAG: hypothetical protein KVP18_003106 [Porospora cf. gigantea A]
MHLSLLFLVSVAVAGPFADDVCLQPLNFQNSPLSRAGFNRLLHTEALISQWVTHPIACFELCVGARACQSWATVSMAFTSEMACLVFATDVTDLEDDTETTTFFVTVGPRQRRARPCADACAVEACTQYIGFRPYQFDLRCKVEELPGCNYDVFRCCRQLPLGQPAGAALPGAGLMVTGNFLVTRELGPNDVTVNMNRCIRECHRNDDCDTCSLSTLMLPSGDPARVTWDATGVCNLYYVAEKDKWSRFYSLDSYVLAHGPALAVDFLYTKDRSVDPETSLPSISISESRMQSTWA